MEQHQSDLLFIASRLLSYPDEMDLQEVKNYVKEMHGENGFINNVESGISPIFHLPLKQLQETYVETFDLKTKLGLYLTAHEFGDSPKRGAAIIRLQKLINEAGYERVEGELADYIPMLYEFLVLTNDDEKNERLERRLACVTQRIVEELPEQNPFYQIVNLLMEFVFEKPTKEEMAEMEQDREEADLEELPYPIMYN